MALGENKESTLKIADHTAHIDQGRMEALDLIKSAKGFMIAALTPIEEGQDGIGEIRCLIVTDGINPYMFCNDSLVALTMASVENLKGVEEYVREKDSQTEEGESG